MTTIRNVAVIDVGKTYGKVALFDVVEGRESHVHSTANTVLRDGQEIAVPGPALMPGRVAGVAPTSAAHRDTLPARIIGNYSPANDKLNVAP